MAAGRVHRSPEAVGIRLIHIGYVEDFATYAAWLWRGDLLPVTSNQDFFGISVMQALYCNCYPLLPRRLAYPELIPTELHRTYLYHDLEDLVDRLDWALRNIKKVRRQNLREIAAQYDWGKMVPQYDAQIEKMGKYRTTSLPPRIAGLAG